MVDKLVEECTETVQEVKLAKITSAENENKNKCSSCTLYIVLSSIIFTVNNRIYTYFIYFHWYLKRDVIRVKFDTYTKQQLNERIDGKRQTNRDQKSNLFFLQRHDQSQKSPLKLLKIR